MIERSHAGIVDVSRVAIDREEPSDHPRARIVHRGDVQRRSPVPISAVGIRAAGKEPLDRPDGASVRRSVQQRPALFLTNPVDVETGVENDTSETTRRAATALMWFERVFDREMVVAGMHTAGLHELAHDVHGPTTRHREKRRQSGVD